MTREEVIFCEKSYLGETNCIDCNYYGTDTCLSRESHRMAIEALEQEPFINKPCISEKVCEHDKNAVLDKIRSEIIELPTISHNANDVYKADVLQILDKHKYEGDMKL